MPYVPIDWLREHVDVPAGTTAEELAAALVAVGLEEEEIHPPSVSGPLVVGKVLTCEKETHKNGKTVNYCRVDVGEHNVAPGTGKEPSELESRGIICGAHNFGVGDYVVVSLPGTTLPGGFEIGARKTYGHWSDGMICSDKELGLGDDHDGIIVLNERFEDIPEPGTSALELLGLGGELLEINVTPDRGYCFSMRGVAREYGHSTGATFNDPALGVDVPEATADGYEVRIEDAAPIHGSVGCDRFVTRIVRGVDPTKPSPKWMKDRLTAAGMRPISLAVDITNYVMLDLGQPLHAYDLDKMNGPIVVRRAKAGESFETLDDITRKLDPEDLLITDSEGARVLGLAGVMGGADTEVSESTTDLLIEAAHFDQVSVARTARRHKIPSEAAKRFERGVDPELPPVAAQRVVDLLVEFGGGTADPAVGDVNNTTAPEPISFDPAQVAGLAGLDLSDDRIAEVLEAIGCTVERGDRWQVTPATWRPDLSGGADLVEEVARIVGYDKIPSIVPTAPVGSGLTADQSRRRAIARSLAEHGLLEVLSFPFTGADRLGIAEGDSRFKRLKLANPLADDAPYLRSNLLSTLLDTAVRNVSRGLERVAIMELGTVVLPKELKETPLPAVGARPSDADLEAIAAVVPDQPWHVAGVLSGPVSEGAALGSSRSYDWADAIEFTTIVGDTVGVPLTPVKTEYVPFHPGRCAELRAGDIVVGHAGELHPDVCAELGLPARTCAFEIDIDALLAQIPDGAHLVSHVSTFPPAKEDFAFVVKDSVTAAEVEQVVRQAAKELTEQVRTFDIYRGAGIPEGHYSIAVALRIRAQDRTLTAEDINQVRNRVIKSAKARIGAELRS
ncbi:phenylalanyl-tRNA synthetase beta subunit [Bowdeniella nasicola]|uniref:Phenylalanine--tRNA ligase beta subunit n=1 Tax=Bowdeniella nasicola TaxID=208480 RepID=A0A1H4B4U1_9ACTO|nr:phenylalanine--tRNA ligase subunit beta [Bowdeniella nasicola]SEA43180.1 phenylalanyl-tRNA synthetase beta subunit [Bowdeniella nasicola]